MEEKKKKMGTLIALVIILVAFFQTIWPSVYPSVVELNRNPTTEYLQIMWFLGPTGLSVLTIIAGCILIAWVDYANR